MRSVLSRIWTRVAVSISYDDNHYTTGNSSIHPKREQNETENLAMVLIDFKTAYDMVPQSLILHCLKMYKIPD